MKTHRKHFEEAKSTINKYTSGWRNRLSQLKRELAAAFSGLLVFLVDLKELLHSLRSGAISAGHAKTERTDGTETRSPGVNDPGTDNDLIEKGDRLLHTMVT